MGQCSNLAIDLKKKKNEAFSLNWNMNFEQTKHPKFKLNTRRVNCIKFLSKRFFSFLSDIGGFLPKKLYWKVEIFVFYQQLISVKTVIMWKQELRKATRNPWNLPLK